MGEAKKSSIISERNTKFRNIKMFNPRNEDDYADDEEFESETPEASNEHQAADINHNNNLDQRALINLISFDRKSGGDNYDSAAYRSKSQNMTKPIDSEVHPKSQVSSPVEGSTSTVRALTTIPTTLQTEPGIRNACLNQMRSLKSNNSTNKKNRRTVTKTYSKLNLKSGK